MKHIFWSASLLFLVFFSPTHCNQNKKSSLKKVEQFRQEQPIKGSESKRIKQLVHYQNQQNNKKFYILICFVQQKQDGQII